MMCCASFIISGGSFISGISLKYSNSFRTSCAKRSVTPRSAEIRARGCYALCAIAEIIAKKIIEIAQTGVRDPAQISALAIKEIGIE
jgi:hypothetical protein